MRRHRTNFRRRPRGNNEEGIVIALVAAFMLVVIGAMMALSIDVVTFYTARSEAQLAADASALAAARVLANSGVTSNSTAIFAEALARKVAKEVARGNSIGGANILGTEVNVAFNDTAANWDTDPHVTVTVTKTDLPTFFARILGTQQVTVAASATAEAYNPTAALGTIRSTPPVAPLCVKPWLLPNLDPTQAPAPGTTPIFERTNGYISNPALVGQQWPSPNPVQNQNGIYALCQNCSGGIPAPLPGAYYPGAIDATDFPVPTQALPACAGGLNSYQLAIAGCVQRPISCGSAFTIKIDTTSYATNRDADTLDAASCLMHYSAANDSDSIDTPITPPFQFVAGNLNPVTGAGDQIMVSNSLVTIPVIDYPGTLIPPTVATPTVTVIGFLQVFIAQSATLPAPPPAGANQLPATIINMAGCGTNASGQPILGNGASPVAVRLISPLVGP